KNFSGFYILFNLQFSRFFCLFLSAVFFSDALYLIITTRPCQQLFETFFKFFFEEFYNTI
ncbi:hypothetical protein DXA13_19910, partial [Clostridium sp. AM58-1XD]